MTVTTTPATDKQMALIHKLIGEKNTGHFGEDTLADLQTVQSGGTLPRSSPASSSVRCSPLLRRSSRQRPPPRRGRSLPGCTWPQTARS
jgi:hypothetical protein